MRFSKTSDEAVHYLISKAKPKVRAISKKIPIKV